MFAKADAKQHAAGKKSMTTLARVPFVLALLAVPALGCPSLSHTEVPCLEDDWIGVPTFVLPEVNAEGGWMASNGGKATGEELLVDATLKDDSLLIHLTNYNGLSGNSIQFRIMCSPEGSVRTEVQSSWSSDLGPTTGPNTDIHGYVHIESRRPIDREPLRLAFRLHAISVDDSKLASPVLLRGALEVPTEILRWSHVVGSPQPVRPGDHAPLEKLREVLSSWSDGQPRSLGTIDSVGRRQGTWVTWWPNGKKQSESVFQDGEREGQWISFWEDGRPFENGLFSDGVRKGRWTEHWQYKGQLTSNVGIYAAGEKNGEWVERWESGSLRARGIYERGLESGLWTRWWQNGNKLFEGSYHKGVADGVWKYWNEDGSSHE